MSYITLHLLSTLMFAVRFESSYSDEYVYCRLGYGTAYFETYLAVLQGVTFQTTSIFSWLWFGRSQWPRGLRHEPSSPARTLGSWVRIALNSHVRESAILLLLAVGNSKMWQSGGLQWYTVPTFVKSFCLFKSWSGTRDTQSPWWCR
jgi:hypothetical protein